MAGIKNNTLFVSRLERVLSDNIEFKLKNKNLDENVSIYSPEACEKCGVREFEDHYVVGEEDNKFSDEPLPVYASLCTECFEESNDAITDEAYRNGASPSHKLKYIICIIRTTDNNIPFVRFNNSISIHNLVVACYYSRVFWD